MYHIRAVGGTLEPVGGTLEPVGGTLEPVGGTLEPVGGTYILKSWFRASWCNVNPLKPELSPICYLLALLGAHHFLHVSRTRVKLLTFRLLMSYIYMTLVA